MMKGVSKYFLFFIDITKVAEVQYAILITTMNCFMVEPFVTRVLKQTIVNCYRTDVSKNTGKNLCNRQVTAYS